MTSFSSPFLLLLPPTVPFSIFFTQKILPRHFPNRILNMITPAGIYRTGHTCDRAHQPSINAGGFTKPEDQAKSSFAQLHFCLGSIFHINTDSNIRKSPWRTMHAEAWFIAMGGYPDSWSRACTLIRAAGSPNRPRYGVGESPANA